MYEQPPLLLHLLAACYKHVHMDVQHELQDVNQHAGWSCMHAC